MAPRRARRGASAALAIGVAMAVTACIGDTDRAEFREEIQRRGGGVVSALAADPLTRLRDELGVADPELLAVSISPVDRVVVIEARDPARPRNVDRYVSRNGGLGDPEPVQISARDDLDARSFRPSELPALGDLEGVADTATAAFGFDDGYVDQLHVGLSNGAPVLTVHVTSARAAGSAVLDASGTLLGATQE